MSNNVPKLRFKGFCDAWKEKKLGDFLEFYTTNSLSRDCLNYKDGSIKNIHYGDIHMKFPVILDVNKYIIPFINDDIDTSKINKESFCKDGDLVIADASEDYNDIGKAIELENIGDTKIVAGLHTILARDEKGITARKFKGYMLLNEKTRKQIKILAAGAKVLGISKSNLVKVSVKLPSLEEQEKIANFLTKVDKIIENQEEKVSNLENYKKGMMQKIFSQEIRFKDENGEEYPGWKVSTFKEILIEDLYPVDKPKERYEKLSIRSHAKGTFSSWVDRPEEVSMDTLYEVKENQLIVNITFAWEHAIAIVKKEDEGKLVSHRFPTYKFKEFAAVKFYKNFIKLKIVKYKLGLASPGGAGRNRVLNKNQFLDIEVPLPCLEEQVKIGEFLSNIDVVIDKEKEKLKELRLWKKGLLQQMFV